MRRTLQTALLAASLLLASCSDDPTSPSGGDPETLPYDVSIEFFRSYIGSLWGTPDGDIVASGSFLLRYDGQDWEPLPLPPSDYAFEHSWGTTNGDVYTIGRNDIHRFDGVRWNKIDRPAYVSDIWGSDDGHIFVAGGGNHRLYHYDGASWTIDSLVVAPLDWGDPWHLVSGGSDSDVYIAGWSGWIGHYDGVDWSASRPDSNKSFWSMWKAPDGPLYLTTSDSLFTYDGSTLRAIDMGRNMWGVRLSGRSASEVYCTAEGDRWPTTSIFRFDGHAWSHLADAPSQLRATWGDRGSNRLYAAGSGVIYQVRGNTVTESFGKTAWEDHDFRDVWGSDTDGIFLVGSYAYRYFEGTWTDLRKQDLTRNRAHAIWGRSGQELYAVGSGMILHYDGDQWTWVSGGAQLNLFAVGGNDRDVFAVGAEGVILRLRDGRWSPMESGTTYWLQAIYAWDDGAFAAGEDGAVLRYDGREWRPFPSSVNWTITDMFGFGPNSIYAVGGSATEICHFDGKTWTPIFIDYVPGFNLSVWGTSEQNLFIGKSQGQVIHFNGHSWSVLPRVMSSEVDALWGTPRGEIIGAGEAGVVRYTR